MSQDNDIKRKLLAAHHGDAIALQELLPLLEDELRAVARARIADPGLDDVVKPAVLVDAACSHLLGQHAHEVGIRAPFFSLAAARLRQILVRHERAKREDGNASGTTASAHVELAASTEMPAQAFDLVRLDTALAALTALDPREARVVELRLFAGLEIEQIADLMDLPAAVVKRDWTMARMWLGRELAA